MTDPDVADATYIEPITPEMVEKIIAKERPDALLPTMGGQTALNTALALERLGRAGEVRRRDDRGQGRGHRQGRGPPEIPRRHGHASGLESPKSQAAHTLDEALEGLEFVGLPAIIRPSFTLAGTGGGIAYNVEEFREIVERGLDLSPTTEVLIEESVLGWKEYEMEVVRDKADNCIIVCSIENIDPMGVHTGDSHHRRPGPDPDRQGIPADARAPRSRCCARSASRPAAPTCSSRSIRADGRMVVIEMNPRVSRSSALASKATGFPIAKVAARLAVGYTLDELMNDITGATPASFEPSIDYVVTKIPRFAFEKYPGAEPYLTTSMKSVGEVMAIGRTFAESLQKALRGLETGLSGLDEIEIDGADDPETGHAAVLRALGMPTPDRLRVIAQAFRHGLTRRGDQRRLFLRALVPAPDRDPGAPRRRRSAPTACRPTAHGFRALKALGFSDARLAKLTGPTEAEVRDARRALGVRPVFKRIDTCAGEFRAETPYMYSTYETGALGQAPECESEPSDRQEGDHPGRRSQPHRPGHRVRLLLLPRGLRARRDRRRVDHGQLQPRDRLHRLRHLRPALFRAADGRGRAGADRTSSSPSGDAAGRHRPVRRPDAAEAGPAAGRRRRPDPRHLARRHRPGRGPRALPAAAAPAEDRPADQRHRPLAATRPSPAPTRSATRW